ncbi:MAG: ProQ/FinO family protein [Gammaproteobacteria bacterium]
MGFEQLAPLKEALVKQATAKKEARKREIGNASNTQPVDPSLRIIGLLQKHFPLAFPKKPAPKIPLKIGIHKDLLMHADALGISETEIRSALKKWCKGKRYTECMEAGAVRVDLQGREAGFVSKEEASYADKRKTPAQLQAPNERS